MLARPSQDEYAHYYESYINLVSEGNLLERLEEQLKETVEFLSSLSEEQGELRYAPNKWSIKEIIGHLTDAERIMSYRLLRIARGDSTPLPGFEEEDYVAIANFDKQTVQQLLDQFVAARRATISLCRSLSDEDLLRRGTANEKVASARSIAYIIAGHEVHHRNIIKERYLQLK